MRASTKTNLSLFEFFEFAGWHPYFAAQVSTGVPQRTSPQCSDVVFQYGWQDSENIGREDFAKAIAQAEELIATILGTFTAPRFVQNDRRNYPRTYDKRALTGFWQADGHLKAIKTSYAQVQAIGVEQLTALDEGAALVYSDTDGDTILDTFTITATVPAGTPADEVAVFFTAADRNNLPQDEFEIRPITVTVSGTTATIKGHRALCVKPDLTLEFSPDVLDVTVAGNFITTADVYRRTVDPSDAGTLIWENVHPAVFAAWTGGLSCNPPCQVEIQTACFGIREMELGYVYPRPAQYNADTAAFTALTPPQHRSPDRVTVNYRAGFPREANGRVNRRLARATALLAVALLPRKKCGCDNVQQYLWELRNLPVDDTGNLEVAQAEIDKASRMFANTNRGAVEAARLIQEYEGWDAVVF